MYNSSEKTYNTYVWDERVDLLGTGATSNVYKARCKNSGQYFAIKVFTENRRCVVNPTLIREMQILEMVDHKNIVKLIKDDSEKKKQYIDVIIMEYCNGGNLATIIEKPENFYGLPESEFLLVLQHITDGMIELHEKKIAHRDIKPNNILLHITSNGQHVYKITDFGAAKSFEGAALSTTVGTEEYLYPEIYERAFYNKYQTDLTPGIDLWSMGVTLYHVATGKLPFRPFDGCRKDRDTMIKITKEKPPGAISGFQNIANGPIEYSKKLPESCQLSKELKTLLEPVLGGLIETKLEKMWPFRKFFEASTNITGLVYINVVNAKNYELIEVALKPSDKIQNISLAIENSTNISKANQLLLCNNLLLSSIVSQKQDIGTFTMKMDEKNPLVLFDLKKPFEKVNLEAFHELPRLTTRLPNKINTATAYCKEISGFFNEIERKILRKTLINESIKNSALTIRTLMVDLKLKQENLINSLKHTTQNLETKSASFAKIYDCISRLDSTKSISAYREQTFDLAKIKKEINEYEAQLNLFTTKLNNLNADNLSIFMKDQTIGVFATHIRRINEECEILYNEFLAERRSTYRPETQLSIFGEFKCRKLNSLIEDAFHLYNNQFIGHIKDFFNKYQKWFNDLVKFHNDINFVENKLKDCQNSLELCKNSIDKDIDTKLSRIISFINEHLQEDTPQSSSTPVATIQNKPQIRPDINNNPINNNNIETGYSIKIGFEKLMNDINSNNNDIVDDYNSINSLVESIHSFKVEATETEKVLDQSNGLLKYLLNSLNNENKNK